MHKKAIVVSVALFTKSHANAVAIYSSKIHNIHIHIIMEQHFHYVAPQTGNAC